MWSVGDSFRTNTHHHFTQGVNQTRPATAVVVGWLTGSDSVTVHQTDNINGLSSRADDPSRLVGRPGL